MRRATWPQGYRSGDGWQQSQGVSEKQLARSLGWFSIGLGLAEVAAPTGLAKFIGVRENHTGLLRMLGMREIASGIGILTRRKPSGWLWSRVCGDAMDLALLGASLMSSKSSKGRVAMATAAVAGVTALDVISAQQVSRSPGMTMEEGALRVKHAITISRTPEELYRFWRDFQNLPRFMKHLESVQVTPQAMEQSAGQTTGQANQALGRPAGGNRSHWVAKAPAGRTVEWDAEIIEDQPNKLIAWRSLEGADVNNSGVVRFVKAPGGRGTTVTVELRYDPPAGALGASVAKLFGEDPDWQVKDDLRRFKQVMEMGEVITTEGQPAGRDSSTSRKYDSAVRR
jgi:uncharacterized membrane protein